MAVTTITPQEFDNIARGTSVTIPVLVQRLDGTPFDLTDFEAFFTVKSAQWDWDYDDLRAYMSKSVLITRPEEGEFYIQLSSKDTWHEPGDYYFDIELVKDGAVFRIALFKFKIVGGPTNRNVNDSDATIALSNSLRITLGGVQPLVFVTPLISEPPENLIETITSDPHWMIEEKDDPVRNIKLRNWGPKVSMVMVIQDPRDGLRRDYHFNEEGHPDPPEDFPLQGAATIQIMNRELNFKLAEEFTMDIFHNYVQYKPGSISGGNYTRQLSSEPYVVANNVASGTLNIVMTDTRRRQIHITGNYMMPHEVNTQSVWAFRIDYFNWDDI